MFKKSDSHTFKHLPISLEIILPIFIGLAIFYVLTDILYSGGRRDNLAAKAESYLLEQSLKFATAPAQNRDQVITISLTDQDLKSYPRAPSKLVFDANLSTYAHLLEKVAVQKPKLIVVSWLTGAHETTQKYWRPLALTMNQLSNTENIFIAYPIAEIGSIPQYFSRKFQVKEGEDCIYDVNNFCTYNKKWRNWLIQSLAERLWNNIPPYHISENLPHALPNFILNLPAPESIPNFSFSEILNNKIDNLSLHDKIIFIGNSVTQADQFKDNKSILRKTYSAASEPRRNLLVDGTPLHIFWAQIAQMFTDHNTVAVAPFFLISTLLLILSLIIIMTLIYFSPAVAVCLFIFYFFAFPTANSFFIRFLNIYIPMFDILYGGFLTFLFSAFGILSFNSYRKYLIEAQQKSFADTADLKGNFISLISHNLNTPIAKLQGLLDILLGRPHLKNFYELLLECRCLVAKLHICIKSVLITTAIDQGAISNSATNLAKFSEDFHDNVGGLLKRLNVPFELTTEDQTILNDIAPTNYHLDLKLVIHACAAAMILLSNGIDPISIHIKNIPPAKTEQSALRISITRESQDTLKVPLSVEKNQLTSFETSLSQDFFTELLLHIINMMTRLYDGSMDIERAPARLTLDLNFSPFLLAKV